MTLCSVEESSLEACREKSLEPPFSSVDTLCNFGLSEEGVTCQNVV